MSKATGSTLTIRILDRDYQVACPDGERENLLASAEYLNQRMNAIRKKGKTLGVERIAVMTALNMARELMDKDQGKKNVADRAISNRLKQLQTRIDAALEDNH